MAVMRHIAEVYLTSGLDAFAEEVIMRAQLVQGSLENTVTVLTAAKDEIHQSVIHPTPEGEPEQQISEEFHLFERNADSTLGSIRSAKVIAGKFLQVLRDMKSRSLSLNPEHITKLDRLRDAVNFAYEQFRSTGIAVHGHIALQHEKTDADEITFEELHSVIQNSSLDSETNDIFYRSQNNLRSASAILNEMVDAAGDFTQLVEFEKAPPPWIVKNKELAGRKVLSAAAEDEIRNLKRDLQERATQLRVRQQEMEEVGMKVELLEKRNKEAQTKLERMTELEKMVEEGANREQDWERRFEDKETHVKKIEEERDNWMRKVAEGTVVINSMGAKGHERSGSGTGDLLIGSKLEMERLRGEIKLLEDANRYLRSQIRKSKQDELVGLESNSWLSTPLKKQASVKSDSAVADAKAVLRNIAMLPLGAKPLRLDIGKDDKSAPRSTPKYQILVEEMRKLKAWEPVRIAGVDMPVMVE
jgi:dynactin 1